MSFKLKQLFLTVVLAVIANISISNSLDSLKNQITASTNDSQKVDLYNEIIFLYLTENSPSLQDSITKYQKLSFEKCREINYRKGAAKTYYLLGKNEMSNRNRLDKSTTLLLKSLSIYEDLKDTEGIASCYLQFGVTSYVLQNYVEAISSLNKTLKYTNSNSSLRPLAQYLVALSYSELNQTNKAIAMFDSALYAYNKLNDSWGVLNCNTFIGKMHCNNGEYQKAIDLLNNIIDNSNYKNDSVALIPTFAFLSTAYLKKKDYKNAIKYGKSVYYKAKNLSGAIIYQKEAETTLYKAYEQTGDIKNALFYLAELNSLKDSIYNISTLQRISELKSKYEFDQELKIQKLEQEKKEAIAHSERKRIKAVNITVTIALIISGILIIVLNRNARQKQKTNKLLNKQNEIILAEQKRSDELLLNILPSQTAKELKEKGYVDTKSFESVTVLFTDFKNFSSISEEMSANELVKEINHCYSAFDKIIEKFNIEKIKTIGDSYMCAGGLPEVNNSHAVDVLNAALEIRDFMFSYKWEKAAQGKPLFEIRIGINTGPVVAGVVGTKKFAYDIWGDTVNIASRMESSGVAGKVNISGSTYELVKDSFVLVHRGKIQAKNKGEIDMYFAEQKI